MNSWCMFVCARLVSQWSGSHALFIIYTAAARVFESPNFAKHFVVLSFFFVHRSRVYSQKIWTGWLCSRVTLLVLTLQLSVVTNKPGIYTKWTAVSVLIKQRRRKSYLRAMDLFYLWKSCFGKPHADIKTLLICLLSYIQGGKFCVRFQRLCFEQLLGKRCYIYELIQGCYWTWLYCLSHFRDQKEVQSRNNIVWFSLHI